jgi:glycosyltransferase involved in cell wall biosynthesis
MFNRLTRRYSLKIGASSDVGPMSKIDIVMWTLNGEPTIGKCLESVVKAIPAEAICHRYVIDGGSTDSTREVAERFGWTVVRANRRGIPYQANQALGLVDTELFASFEQDIGLNPAWFRAVMAALTSDPSVAVAQGLRAASGSRYLEAIDDYGVRHGLVPRWIYSIDNNLYRTEALRSVGGFPMDCAMSADGAMRNNLFRSGWKWKVCRDVVSLHYRDSFGKHLRHVIIQSAENKVLWETYPEYRIPDKLGRLVATPFTSARMASEAHEPGVFIAYPLLRAVRIFSRVIGSLSKQYRFMEVRSQP